MTTKKLSPSKLYSDTDTALIRELDPLSPLKFPTLQEIAEEDRHQQEKPMERKLTGLFAGILGDLTPLLSDFQHSPAKYGEEVHALLERLGSGRTSLERLSRSDQRLLDLATYDFFQTVPAPKPKAEVTATPAKKKGKKQKAERPRPRPGIDVPVTELPAYWWLQ